MKVLVTYFTMTGNTEKIAKAIHDEVSKEHEADLKKIDEVGADTFKEYDLVFVGTPAHAGDLAGPVKEVMNSLPKSPKYKLAGFYTHMAPIWDKEVQDALRGAFEKIAKEKSIDYRGTYNCMGNPDPNVAKMVKEARKMPDDEFNEYLEEAIKHPSLEDEQKAREFAKEVLSKIK
ncbi:MAG: flavodoxin family protein [Candidatus Jordarchaeum sp.]|uniref:flavodoxin family protein n=1 Tax=Candidatus Jordarchaeum sp. TaxID=2823881 RepID=UPI0040491A97